MQQLNFSSFSFRFKNSENKVLIFDEIRKKFIILTPEEWVRQHVVHHLLYELKYPKSLIKIESGLKYNQLQKRSDVVVYNREGNPWLLMECKAPDLKLNQNVVMQVAVYNNDVKAKYIAISNGMQHVCYEVKQNVSETELLKTFPEYQ